MSIEEPVYSCGESEAVLHYVGTSIRNRPDVGRLGFCFAAAVDHMQPRYSASVFISFTNFSPKARVANLSVEKNLDYTPLLFALRRIYEQSSGFINMPRIKF